MAKLSRPPETRSPSLESWYPGGMRKLILLSVVMGAGAVVACTGDPVTVQPPVDASTNDGNVIKDGSSNDGTVTDDAGDDGGLVELDGGTVDDAGGNPDPDGGVSIDAGADAGVCGPPSGNGPTFSSTCSSNLIIYTGGTLAVGTYDLTGFTVVGSTSYCGTYVPGTYSGKLVVTSLGNGSYRFDERAVRSNVISLPQNRSYTVTAAGSTLTATQTCGYAINDTSWGYSSGKVNTDAGVKVGLTYAHALGTASIRYRWTHQ